MGTLSTLWWSETFPVETSLISKASSFWKGLRFILQIAVFSNQFGDFLFQNHKNDDRNAPFYAFEKRSMFWTGSNWSRMQSINLNIFKWFLAGLGLEGAPELRNCSNVPDSHTFLQVSDDEMEDVLRTELPYFGPLCYDMVQLGISTTYSQKVKRSITTKVRRRGRKVWSFENYFGMIRGLSW